MDVSAEKFAKMQNEALNAFTQSFTMDSDSSDSPMKKLGGFGRKTDKGSKQEWSNFEGSNDGVSGDLEFNDLEISFDKK